MSKGLADAFVASFDGTVTVQQILDDARVRVTTTVGKAKGQGVTGKIRFDELGDTTNVVFTLYRVQGSPLGFSPTRP